MNLGSPANQSHPSFPSRWKRLLAAACLSLFLSLSWISSAVAQTPHREEGSLIPAEDVRIAPLLEKLTDRNWHRRLDAADALVAIGAPALPSLTTALQSPNASLRWRVASVLGDLGPEAASAVPNLMVALQDPDPQVRLYATLALGNIGREAKMAIPQLIATLQDPDSYVRTYVPIALRKVGAQGNVAVSALTTVLRDANPQVRLNAAYALGALGREAEPAIPNLVETLLDAQPYVRLGAVKSLANIASAFQDQAPSLSSRKLTGLIATFEQVLSLLENPDQGFTLEDIARVRRPLSALQAEQDHRFGDKVLQLIQQHPWWLGVVLYILVLPLACVVLLQLKPLWLLAINDTLKPYTDFVVPLLGINVPLRSLLLVGGFHYHPRVLDAWVARHLTVARQQFSQKPTVRDRQHWVPLPVVFDGTTLPQLQAANLHPVFNIRRSRLLIVGEGGIGKTSLACQIGQWAMALDPTQRLCPHPMLPLLLEEPLPDSSEPAGTRLLVALQGQLQTLIDASEPVNLGLMERLLRHKRLLVIVDRFSEMPSATRTAIQPDLPDFLANGLVVTSRQDETLGRSSRTTLKPLRIESNKLSSFMEAYLMQQGQREQLNDAEFFAACQNLSQLVGARSITVLLAKLYAELLIRKLQQPKPHLDFATLPDDIPSLMLGYLNELNRDITTQPLADRVVHQDAKALAWACVQSQFYPNPILRTAAIAALAAVGQAEPETHLDYLETKLRLIETVGASQDRLRFCLDPLAEYLAALAVAEQVACNPEQWQPLILDAVAQLKQTVPLDTMRGFLLALRDVWQTQTTPFSAQDFESTELWSQFTELTESTESLGR
jgi:HEAT repeat protein